MLLNSLLDQQVVFFGGKGGVGKTTCSSAFALAASRRGQRVLLVSTDPAHSTSDIFEPQIGPAERELQPRLWALEIDADGEAARYVAEVKRDIERMFSPSVIRQAHRQIDMAAASPGLLEVALLDRMIDLIVERGDAYDLIVFDTAPTGHTVQLLRMPEAMDDLDPGAREASPRHARDRSRRRTVAGGRPAAGRSGAGGARAPPRAAGAAARPSSPIAAHVVRARHDSGAARDRGDRARGGTARPRPASTSAALIVNRVLPEDLEGEFYRRARRRRRVYLREIEQPFPAPAAGDRVSSCRATSTASRRSAS